MRIKNVYKRTAALIFLMVAALWPTAEAWGQETQEPEYVTENRYTTYNSVGKEGTVTANVTPKNAANIFDWDDNSFWIANNYTDDPVTFSFDLEESKTFNVIQIYGGGKTQERPVSIRFTSDSFTKSFDNLDISDRNLTLDLGQEITTSSFKLEFVPQDQYNAQIALNEVTLLLTKGLTIQHKPAKWHKLREGGQFVDSFDDTKQMISSYSSTGVQGTDIQATHTLVDTIYMNRGQSITLNLPDNLDDDYSIKTYQRWYSFRREATFETNHVDGAPYDLLTPSGNQAGYRLTNGYVGSPLTNTVLSSMDFYFPTSDEAKKWFGTGFDDSWFLVACDVSGYTDYTKEFDLNNSKNSDFRNTLCEPTLSHRIIYYICAIDNPNNWYAKNIRSATGDKYMEEYEITMPATRIPNKTEEMIALSKDARSFAVPNGNVDDIDISLEENSAGIDLITESLSGEGRVVHFSYPKKNTDGTYSVNGPTATICVKKGSYNLARYHLTFQEDFRLLTQTQVDDENKKGVESDYQFRMPDFLKENYILLNELNFDYDADVQIEGYQDGVYPYPMNWDYSTYGFYDGGVLRVKDGDKWELGSPADFEGGNRPYPEWGYYGILNKYVESGGWAWGNSASKNNPRDDMAIRYNSSGEKSTYHLYADVSDRPGVVARLPFETNLCKGSEITVTAWVKSARGGAINANDNNNAAMLFTIMGVSKGVDGENIYTPIYRYQTGQIPVTYSNDANVNLPGFGVYESNGYRNDWFQAYFSFTNSSELSFNEYILQVDNNSASTKGGDMYLDDVRVYISRPMAQVQQLSTACSTERTLMTLRLDWDRLMARVGGEGTNEVRNMGICFVDTLLFHNTFTGNNYEDALRASAVHLGQGENSYEFRVLKYNLKFDENEPYDENDINLAVENPDKDAFYSLSGNSGQFLAVDFYGSLIPGRAYWVLLLPEPDVQYITSEGPDDNPIHLLNPLAFSGFYDNPCAVKTDFQVTGNTTVKVDGQIVTPETEFCRGNVNNFTVELQVPRGDGSDTMETLPANAVYFDWFFGESRDGEIADPAIQYTELVRIENGEVVLDDNGVSLQTALTEFRNQYPNEKELNEDMIDNDFTRSMYDLIYYYLHTAKVPVGSENRPLVLYQPSLNITLLDVMRVVVCPIPLSVSEEVLAELGYSVDEWKTANICWGYTYLELVTTGDAPSVHAGFNTVAYPADLADRQSLRIGLKQIESVSSGDSYLTVDLRDASSYDVNNNNFTLQLIGGNNPDEVYNKIYLTDTDDPIMLAFINEQGASFDNKSLPIGEVKSFEAHYYTEGTTTRKNEMQLQFILDEQNVLINGENKKFTFKPREGYYYTFNVYFEEAAISGSATACYGRFPLTMKVVPEYLVWHDTQKTDDYLTIGNWNNDRNWQRIPSERIHAEESVDSEYFTDGTNDTSNAFVPMLFSKVVIPANGKIWLYQAGYGENGSWINSDRPAGVADPTQNIQYDLMAYDHPEGQLKTERYRVSLLNQIHFEPGAEMLHAEYLLYDTAWVDYQLDKGRWYTLASPLNAVYAGDFYTDKSGTEESEYFQPIYYSESDNNRFNPSVYQRGWKGSNATMVGTPGGERAIAGNWSALYNKVDEAYTPGTGFSLKVQDATGNVTFRLPKADASYTYYSYDGNTSGDPTTISRDVDDSGRLKSDELLDRRTDNASLSTSFTIELADAHGGYYLVGNPFMAHLDMVEFFNENTSFAEMYWLVTEKGQEVAVGGSGDGLISTGTGKIAPLQSFFVKLKTDEAGNLVEAPENITFTQEMQTLGGTGDGLRSANALTITATTTDGRTSRAAVAYDMAASADYEASEDAELFLDSNLGDVPMVYTVAGTMATSINRTSELYNIPLGVYGSKQEMVTLSFGGLNQFSSATLYDAQEQTETPLHEGKTVSVPAGTSGRYFLRAGTPTGNEVIARNAFLVYSVGGGKVMVTSSNTPLKDIRVYTMGGAQVRSIQASGMQQEIYLNRGIYLITVSDQDGLQETRKVLVR